MERMRRDISIVSRLMLENPSAGRDASHFPIKEGLVWRVVIGLCLIFTSLLESTDPQVKMGFWENTICVVLPFLIFHEDDLGMEAVWVCYGRPGFAIMSRAVTWVSSACSQFRGEEQISGRKKESVCLWWWWCLQRLYDCASFCLPYVTLTRLGLLVLGYYAFSAGSFWVPCNLVWRSPYNSCPIQRKARCARQFCRAWQGWIKKKGNAALPLSAKVCAAISGLTWTLPPMVEKLW